LKDKPTVYTVYIQKLRTTIHRVSPTQHTRPTHVEYRLPLRVYFRHYAYCVSYYFSGRFETPLT